MDKWIEALETLRTRIEEKSSNHGYKGDSGYFYDVGIDAALVEIDKLIAYFESSK